MMLSRASVDYLSALPSELLDAVFNHLNTQELTHLRRLNRRLNSEINSNASIISKKICIRENSRIQDAIHSNPSFEDLTLIQTLRLYTKAQGIPPPFPVDIDLHARRLASWYRASNAKHSRGAIALAWERSASGVFAFYFYLHHAIQRSTDLQAQMVGNPEHHVNSKMMSQISQLRDEACVAVNTQSLRESTYLRSLAANTNARSMPSPWRQSDALESAFRSLQIEPLAGSPAQDTEHELSELRRISNNVAAACSSSMFDTTISGNPNAALEWALTQKAGLHASGAQFRYNPRPSARRLFESAITRVRDFSRDPLLVAAVWECVEAQPT